MVLEVAKGILSPERYHILINSSREKNKTKALWLTMSPLVNNSGIYLNELP